MGDCLTSYSVIGYMRQATAGGGMARHVRQCQLSTPRTGQGPPITNEEVGAGNGKK